MEKRRFIKRLPGIHHIIGWIILLTFMFNANTGFSQSSCVKGDYDFKVDGYTVTFKATTSGPVLISYWYYNSQIIGKGDLLKYTFKDTGKHEVCLVLLGYDTINNKRCEYKFCDDIIIRDTCHLRTEFDYRTDGNKALFEASSNSSTVKYFWKFSDQNYRSEGRLIRREFKNGTYKVCLFAKDTVSGCVAEYCETVTINNCDLTVGFDFKSDGLKTVFEGRSNSSNAIYTWNFGDGHEGRGRVQRHLYSKFGRYEVCLNVIDTVTNCKARICKIVELDDSCDLEARFGYKLDSNLLVLEGGSNSGNAVYHWLFGDDHDGSGRVTRHKYSKPGRYEVCLIVIDTVTKCKQKICKVIEIDGCDLEAKFGYRLDSNHILLEAGSNSRNVVYKWSFGDGHSGSGRITRHRYTKPGKYEICLFAIDTTNHCKVKVCRIIVIEDDSCEIKANFNYKIDGSLVIFEGESNSRDAHYIWHFGDGSDESGRIVRHKFRKGTYKVCLTVISADEKCRTTVCKEIRINPCDLEGGFTYRNKENRFIFSGRSTDRHAIYMWDFGDGSYAVGPRPRHMFHKSGIYNVCLTIISKASGCRIKICKRVEVKDRCDVKVDFRYTNRNNEYKFFAQSNKRRVVYIWDFGDGHRGKGTYASHKYEKPGKYQVCVTAYDLRTKCKETICKYITVEKRCELEANFRYEISDDGKVWFRAKTNQDNVRIFWDFGDGSRGKGARTTHQYQKSGKYKVCMYAVNSDGCKVHVCKEIAVRVRRQMANNTELEMSEVGSAEKNISDNTIAADLEKVWSITLTPNPVSSSGTVSITGSSGSRIEVINMLGTVVWTERISGSDAAIDVKDLERGYYFIKVINNTNDVKQLKFLKQ